MKNIIKKIFNSLNQYKLPLIVYTFLFSVCFAPKPSHAEDECLELSCFYIPQGGMGIRGYAKKAFPPDQRNYKKFPLVFWGQDLKIIFVKENTVAASTAQKAVRDFISGINDLGLPREKINPDSYDFQLRSADKIDKDVLNFNARPADYFDLGKSKYRNLNISVYSYILNYNNSSELDFLEVKLSPSLLEIDPMSGQSRVTRKWITHQYDFPAPLGPNIFIFLNDDSISVTSPRNIHKTYENERYMLKGQINLSGCKANHYVDSIERRFVTVLMYLSIERSSPKNCLPLLFGIPLTYQDATQAFDRLLKIQASDAREQPVRIEDLLP